MREGVLNPLPHGPGDAPSVDYRVGGTPDTLLYPPLGADGTAAMTRLWERVAAHPASGASTQQEGAHVPLPHGRALPPPPPLPYKVDTPRPSLRTNWTRLVQGAHVPLPHGRALRELPHPMPPRAPDKFSKAKNAAVHQKSRPRDASAWWSRARLTSARAAGSGATRRGAGAVARLRRGVL